MHKLHCLLRYDSLMFIGFPVGRDDVVYNSHRVYSIERMAMMFAGESIAFFTNFVIGWRLQAVYYDDRNDPYDFSAKDFNERAPGPDRAFRRLLFVLKKN